MVKKNIINTFHPVVIPFYHLTHLTKTPEDATAITQYLGHAMAQAVLPASHS
jgi:hypothetical protein